MITIFSSNVNIERRNIDYELNVICWEMDALHEELTDLTLQIEVANATHDEEINYLYQEIHSLRRQIAEARASCPYQTQDPSCRSI